MMNSELRKLITGAQKEVKRRIPSKKNVHEWLEKMTDFLFPSYNIYDNNPSRSEEIFDDLKIDLIRILKPVSHYLSCSEKKLASDYFDQIPKIYKSLYKDANAILEFDPAAHTLEEVISAYPGFYAIMVYRLAHPFYNEHLPFLARQMTEFAHRETGIDIHPGAKIGESFFIDHGTGIVIGETTEIGNNVKIYQGVTLGALNVKKELAKTKRHPTIQDNVIIYSGATILGGTTIIGHDSVIGGNVWLTESIENQSIVYHKNEVHIKNGNSFDEPINFFI